MSKLKTVRGQSKGDGVYQALVRAIKEARLPTKDASAEDYDYVSAESIFFTARTALVNNDLALVCSESCVERDEDSKPFALHQSFVLTHAPTGDALDVPATPWPLERAADPASLRQIVAAAKTSQLRYVLRDLLLLPQVDPLEDEYGRPRVPRSAPSAAEVVDEIDYASQADPFAGAVL